MSLPMPKGVLVYADGRTELLDHAPAGKIYVRPCSTCGGQAVFDSAEMMAEDGNTIADTSHDALSQYSPDRFKKMNAGCIVYIQRWKL